MSSDLPADIREARAGEPDAGKRLDRFLSAAFPELSRSRLQALIAQGAVTHDAATIGDANKRVKPGELYRLHVPAATPAEPRGQPALTFSLSVLGKEVVVICDGRTTRLRSVRGLPILARLVEHPGQELHVLDLAAEADADAAIADAGDAGEVLDAKAREAYQRRIVDLREEIDEADRFADVGRADRARRELDMLLQQLSSAVGLGGRSRRSGSASERARITVQRRVREAIKKIADHESELGRHLDWAIRTGTFCAYEPMGRKTAR